MRNLTIQCFFFFSSYHHLVPVHEYLDDEALEPLAALEDLEALEALEALDEQFPIDAPPS